MVVLASCQEVAKQPAPGDVAAAGPDYPNLHTVPPRPQLSYTVEQRRAIVDGLVADRENARYRNDVARYRAGLSDVPPPAAPAFAAVPLEPQPDPADAADAVAPAQTGRDAPANDPATEFLYEDDDFDSFMKEMDPADGGRDAEPEANAAPLGTKLIRASAVRPVPQAAAPPGRAPVVTLAMPPATVSLPVPAPAETTLAGRAPAVVWGMPDMMPPPAEPDAMQPATTSRRPQYEPQAAPVETSLAGHAPGVVWGMPDLAPAPAGPMPAVPARAAHGAGGRASPPAPAPIETVLAGRAPGVVWGMPDLAPAPAGPKLPAAPSTAAHSGSAARAAPPPAPAAPAEMVLAAAAGEPAQRTHEPRQVAPPVPAPPKPAPPSAATAVLAGPASAPVQVTAMAEGGPAETAAGSMRAAPPRPPPAKPVAIADATVLGPATMAPSGGPAPHPAPKPAAEIELAGGPVGIDAGGSGPRATALGSVAFDPQSALLSPHAIARLRQLLAEAAAREARIQVVGEAAAPALALDRALAVGLALVQSGVSADRLQLTLARGGSSDQARLFLAVPEL